MFRSLNRKTFSLYDVTLTKTLLNIQEYIPLLEKKGIFDSILSKSPDAIEVGSFISPEVFPQIKYSEELFEYAKDKCEKTDIYMVVPNFCQYFDKAVNLGVENISIDLSVSDEYMKNNIYQDFSTARKTILENINKNNFKNTKVYLDNIGFCPYKKEKLHLREIFMKIESILECDEITHVCLADSNCTMCWSEWNRIFDIIYKKQLPISKLSLKLGTDSNGKYLGDVRYTLLTAYFKSLDKIDISNIDPLDNLYSTQSDKQVIDYKIYDDIIESINRQIQVSSI